MRASHRTSAFIAALVAVALPFASVTLPTAVATTGAPAAKAPSSGTSTSLSFNRAEPNNDQERWEAYAYAPARYKPLAEMTVATVRTGYSSRRVVRLRMADVLEHNRKHRTNVGFSADGEFHLFATQFSRKIIMASR